MVNIDSYINWFRGKAVDHAGIRHDVASEDLNGPAGKRGFTLFTAEEVLKQLRFSVNVDRACLHLNLFEKRGNRRELSSEVDQVYQGAFMVTKKLVGRQANEMQVLYSDTERIYQDILNDMIEESIWGDECKVGWLIDSYDIHPIGPIWDNRYGWLIEFNFYKK